jgi:hypothetical protein
MKAAVCKSVVSRIARSRRLRKERGGLAAAANPQTLFFIILKYMRKNLDASALSLNAAKARVSPCRSKYSVFWRRRRERLKIKLLWRPRERTPAAKA